MVTANANWGLAWLSAKLRQFLDLGGEAANNSGAETVETGFFGTTPASDLITMESCLPKPLTRPNSMGVDLVAEILSPLLIKPQQTWQRSFLL